MALVTSAARDGTDDVTAESMLVSPPADASPMIRQEDLAIWSRRRLRSRQLSLKRV
jgi:hypothetical protein